MSSVLITGASRGIGRAVAVELAKRGHRVIATARQPDDLADLDVDQRLRLDVTDQDSVDRAVEAAGEVDVLVSNAGATVRAPLEGVPLAEVEKLFQLNTFGALRTAKAVLPAMRERGEGRLVFVSSIQGRIVLPINAAYCASKWALEAMAEGIALEAGHFGVKVSIVQPGAVATEGASGAPSFFAADDPYLPLYQQFGAFRDGVVPLEEVAAAVADTVEHSDPPLRVPVGASAERALTARKQAPEDKPFWLAQVDW